LTADGHGGTRLTHGETFSGALVKLMRGSMHLATWDGGEHGRPERHTPSAGRGHVDAELAADLRRALDAVHEWVPLPVGREVGQHLPDRFGRAGMSAVVVMVMLTFGSLSDWLSSGRGARRRYEQRLPRPLDHCG